MSVDTIEYSFVGSQVKGDKWEDATKRFGIQFLVNAEQICVYRNNALETVFLLKEGWLDVYEL